MGQIPFVVGGSESAGMRRSYSALSRLNRSQKGSDVSPLRRAASMSRCACQPVLTPTIIPRVGRRRWTTVSSTFSPLGSSTIETSLSSFPQVKTSFRRIELDDPALHPVLLAEALRPLARRVGQLAVAPDE